MTSCSAGFSAVTPGIQTSLVFASVPRVVPAQALAAEPRLPSKSHRNDKGVEEDGMKTGKQGRMSLVQ